MSAVLISKPFTNFSVMNFITKHTIFFTCGISTSTNPKLSMHVEMETPGLWLTLSPLLCISIIGVRLFVAGIRLWPLRSHWPIGYVSSFSEENCWCYGHRLSVMFQQLVRLGSFLFPIHCNLHLRGVGG